MPGIVMCRDALLHRSHEIQPAHFDSFVFFFYALWDLFGPRLLFFLPEVQEVVSNRSEPMAETLRAQTRARKRNEW